MVEGADGFRTAVHSGRGGFHRFALQGSQYDALALLIGERVHAAEKFVFRRQDIDVISVEIVNGVQVLFEFSDGYLPSDVRSFSLIKQRIARNGEQPRVEFLTSIGDASDVAHSADEGLTREIIYQVAVSRPESQEPPDCRDMLSVEFTKCLVLAALRGSD